MFGENFRIEPGMTPKEKAYPKVLCSECRKHIGYRPHGMVTPSFAWCVECHPRCVARDEQIDEVHARYQADLTKLGAA
jgi:hypothetical protein